MPKTIPDIFEVIYDAIARWWVYCFYVIVGIVGKFSWDISRKKRITWLGAISSVGISGFIGYISSVYCHNNGLEKKAAYIVPICTLLSDKIITYLVLRIRWKEIKNAIVHPDNAATIVIFIITSFMMVIGLLSGCRS